MKLFNSQLSIILWKGSHNLNQRKKKWKLRNSFGLGIFDNSKGYAFQGQVYRFIISVQHITMIT